MLTYAGFCPSGQTLPAYPNYSIPIQVGTRTHLYTSAVHDIRVDYGLMMSSDFDAIKWHVGDITHRHRGLSSDFVSLTAQQQLSAFCDPSACS